MIQMNLFTNSNRLIDIEINFIVTKEERGRGNKLGVWE